MADQSIPQGVEFIWEQAEKRLEAQLQQATSLDTKAAVLLGFHGAALTALAAQSSRLLGFERWLGLGIVAGLIMSGFCALQAFRVRDYDRRPAPESLSDFIEWTTESLKYRFISTRFEALEKNRRKLDLKSSYLNSSLLTISFVAVALASTAIYRILG